MHRGGGGGGGGGGELLAELGIENKLSCQDVINQRYVQTHMRHRTCTCKNVFAGLME